MGRNLSGWQLRVGQKRGAAVGKTKRGKGTKWMVLVDGQGISLGAQLASASPAEVTLAEATIAAVRVPCWARRAARRAGLSRLPRNCRFRRAPAPGRYG